VRSLIAPLILGVDFLQKHGITLDFTSNPVGISSHMVDDGDGEIKDTKSILEMAKGVKARVYMVEEVLETEDEVIDNCAVPVFGKTFYDMPECGIPSLAPLLDRYKSLFATTPGNTNLTEHFIPTVGTPVKIPPRRIPANYRAEVEQQIRTVLSEGIIEERSSPWMAPAVFVRKKMGYTIVH